MQNERLSLALSEAMAERFRVSFEQTLSYSALHPGSPGSLLRKRKYFWCSCDTFEMPNFLSLTFLPGHVYLESDSTVTGEEGWLRVVSRAATVQGLHKCCHCGEGRLIPQVCQSNCLASFLWDCKGQVGEWKWRTVSEERETLRHWTHQRSTLV